MKRVLASELEYPGDGLYYLDGEPFTGIAFNLAKAGWEKSQIEYRQGLLWGHTTEWYSPGLPMVDSNYFRGALHGRAREWHKNGQIAEDGEYEYGIVLWEKEWDEDGNIIKDYKLKESSRQHQALMLRRKTYGSSAGGGSGGSGTP